MFDNDSEEENQQLLQQQISAVPTLSNKALITAETSSSVVEAAEVAAEPRLRRGRKRPIWMQDYEVTCVQSDSDDTIAYYALFSDCDPVIFQESVKDLKWQKAMDEEICSIEKNES